MRGTPQSYMAELFLMNYFVSFESIVEVLRRINAMDAIVRAEITVLSVRQHLSTA